MTLQEFMADMKKVSEKVTALETKNKELETTVTKQSEIITSLQTTGNDSGKDNDKDNDKDKDNETEVTVTDAEAEELEKLLQDF